MVIKYRDRVVLKFDFNQCLLDEKVYRAFDIFSFIFTKNGDVYSVSIISTEHFESHYCITLYNTDLSVLEQEVDSFMAFLSYI